MKKNRARSILTATGLGLASMALVTTGSAQTSDPILNALIRKGILTEGEAKQVLAEVDAQKKDVKTNAFVLPLGKEANLRLGGFIHGQAEVGKVDSWLGGFTDNPLHAKTDPTARFNSANPTSGDRSASHDRMRLRRARISVSGDFLEKFDFKAEGDFQQGDGLADNTRTAFSATDIYVNYNQFPEANLRFGQYKAPFGLEQLTSDTVLYTPERSLVTTALTPERQVGLQLYGKPLARVTPNNKELLEYAVGVFNGNGRNTLINDDPYFEYVGRISSTFLNTKLWDQPLKWRIGGNGYYNRYAPGTRIGTQLRLNPVDGSLSTLNAASSSEGFGWGVDTTLTFGPFDLIAEYMEGNFRANKYGTNLTSFFLRNTPTSSTGSLVFIDDIVANGYYVQGSYFFPGGRKYQLVGKWESFNPHQDPYFRTGTPGGDNISTLTAGFNWYIKGDYIKLMFDYMHTWSEFREKHSGSGAKEFDMGMVRVQLMF